MTGSFMGETFVINALMCRVFKVNIKTPEERL